MVLRVWPREHYRQDDVAQELDEAAEKVGASVLALDNVGGAINNRLMGYHGETFLIEYKTGQRKYLRPSQRDFRDSWRGQWAVVSTQEELFAVLGVSLATEMGCNPSTVRNLRRPTWKVLTIPGLGLTLDPTTGELVIGDTVSLLTPVQNDLMAFLVANAGRCFSCVSLLSAVWQYPPGIGSRDLVRMHVRDIRRKTGTGYPCNRRGFGYFMPADERGASHTGRETQGLDVSQATCETQGADVSQAKRETH